MLNFSDEILYGHLVKRYKRFFMDIRLESGELVVAHTPNTGSMKGLLQEDNLVMLTKNNDPKRKTRYSTQAIKVGEESVGINTHLPNKLVRQSLDHECLAFLRPYKKVNSEVAYGKDLRSRIDLFFNEHTDNEPPFYLEIKNVTLKIDESAQFPDAVSTRAQKHIEDLMHSIKLGFKSGLIFIVQRQDCQYFTPAQEIDKKYAILLSDAKKNGLLIKALCSKIDSDGLRITHEIPCKI